MSDSFLAAFDKLTGLGDAPSGGDVAAAMASIPADTMPAASQDNTQAAADTVDGGQDSIQAAADTIEGGADTDEGGQDSIPAAADTIEGGQDSIPAAPAKDDEDDAFIARLRKLVTAPEPPPAQPAARQQDEPPPILSAEDQEFLTTYEKDWPDVAKAEALRRRVEYTHLLNHVYTQVASFMRPHIETLDALATRTHHTDLTSREPAYDDVRDQVVDWVSRQPKYLQAAYGHVIEQGTADEVVDLIGRWRMETKQPAGTPAATAPKPKDTALPPAAKQAAAALAPVVSKRSAPTAGVDPGDFNSAFEAAAAADKL